MSLKRCEYLVYTGVVMAAGLFLFVTQKYPWKALGVPAGEISGASITGTLEKLNQGAGIVSDNEVTIENLLIDHSIGVKDQDLGVFFVKNSVIKDFFRIIKCHVNNGIQFQNVVCDDLHIVDVRAAGIGISDFSSLDSPGETDLLLTGCTTFSYGIHLENIRISGSCSLFGSQSAILMKISNAVITRELNLQNTKTGSLYLSNLRVNLIDMRGIELSGEMDLSGLKAGEVGKIRCDPEMAEHIARAAPGIPLIY